MRDTLDSASPFVTSTLDFTLSLELRHHHHGPRAGTLHSTPSHCTNAGSRVRGTCVILILILLRNFAKHVPNTAGSDAARRIFSSPGPFPFPFSCALPHPHPPHPSSFHPLLHLPTSVLIFLPLPHPIPIHPLRPPVRPLLCPVHLPIDFQNPFLCSRLPTVSTRATEKPTKRTYINHNASGSIFPDSYNPVTVATNTQLVTPPSATSTPKSL